MNNVKGTYISIIVDKFMGLAQQMLWQLLFLPSVFSST
jgi:hypothetical protein